jgi:membrane fusion protein, multidrug efflux system
MRLDRRYRGLFTLSLILCIASCSSSAPPPPPPPTEVGIITVAAQAVPIELNYAARTAGLREVEVRARVSGILQRRAYTEGARVKEGELLFRIDPAPYAAEVERARAQVAVEAARAAEARQQRERAETLVTQGVVSKREFDTAIAAAASSQATLDAAKAALRKAQLDLSYTEVRAPISGLTSREARSEGSLINSSDDSALLTRIAQTNQLYVEFSLPVTEANWIRTLMRGTQSPVRVAVDSAEGRDLKLAAILEFIDTQVDEFSGTVQARATLDNPQSQLLPGQFVRARVLGVTLSDATALPVRAVLRNPMGSMVWVVDAKNKVQPRPVQLGQTLANQIVILSGIRAGERVVVDGVIKLQPGAIVKPITALAEH